MAAAAAATAAVTDETNDFPAARFGDDLVAPLLEFQEDALTELMADDGLTVVVSAAFHTYHSSDVCEACLSHPARSRAKTSHAFLLSANFFKLLHK